MRRLTLRARIAKSGKNTLIRVFLQGEGLPQALNETGVEITLYNHVISQRVSLYDGFMFMFIFLAMEKFDVFEIDGPVSRKALRNIQIFQEAWHCQLPKRYNICKISVKRSVDDFWLGLRKREKAISAFSGGLDATFLALRHTSGSDWSYPLERVLMVHGFDVKYDNDDAFARLVNRVTPFLAARGLRPLIAKTDVRKYELQDWEHSFASQLSGLLHLYRKSFSYAVIGSSEPYNALIFPWGSTPATDYLLSGGAMEIVHEGAGYSRTEKAELVATNPEARRALKVCWEGSDQASNCGVCEKCVRTKLNFMAVGCDAPECFSTPAGSNEIAQINVRNAAQLNELQSILDYCYNHDIKKPWVNDLEDRIAQIKI